MFKILGAGLLASLLAGCYSFSGTTLPPHLRTLRIHPVENQTLEASLGDKITQGLSDGFRSRSNLRPVNEGGDAAHDDEEAGEEEQQAEVDVAHHH